MSLSSVAERFRSGVRQSPVHRIGQSHDVGAIYEDQLGWDMFTCPSIDRGGLPPANTFAANSDGLPNEAQPPAMATPSPPR